MITEQAQVSATQPWHLIGMRLYPAAEHRPFTFGRSSRRALLIHGFPGTPWELRAVGSLLADLGFEAHGPLLPGFGPDIRSLGARNWHDWLEEASSALHAQLENAEEVVLVGYSMGAALAIALAAGLPTQSPPLRLVLINPFAGLNRPLAALVSLGTPFIASYRPFVRADFDDPWVREVLGRVLPDLDVDDLEWRELMRREVRIPTVAVDQVRRLGAAAWRRAPDTVAPALVLQGREDRVISPRRTRRLCRRLGGTVRYRETSGSHVIVWPGKSGHDELIREIERFILETNDLQHEKVTVARRRTR